MAPQNKPGVPCVDCGAAEKRSPMSHRCARCWLTHFAAVTKARSDRYNRSVAERRRHLHRTAA